MTQLLIYAQPLALNRHEHKHLRIHREQGDFGFARSLNSVPLTTVEFARAARDFPIVFAGADEADTGMPAALLGLSREENLFVDGDGHWADQTYVPAFLRRYPFVVANHEASAVDFTVCVDEAVLAAGDEGLRLFEDSGEDAPALTHAIDFLGQYQRAVLRTQEAMQQLREFKLLIPKSVKVERAGGETQSLTGFSVVDETRLQKLGGKALDKLSRTGTLGLLYVHLMSLSNVQRLSERLDARSGALPH